MEDCTRVTVLLDIRYENNVPTNTEGYPLDSKTDSSQMFHPLRMKSLSTQQLMKSLQSARSLGRPPTVRCQRQITNLSNEHLRRCPYSLTNTKPVYMKREMRK
jgi:hypothetical protein